ncbi:MAG: ferritin-like domain-containing protein [Thermoproteota archaeon]|nr:ferritin-like domain-containing protein [Thermoproteota archaeon]
MGEIIDKVKDKAKDVKETVAGVKDTVVDVAKSIPNLDIMTQKFSLELNAALAMENAGIERLQYRITETLLPEARQRMQHHVEESRVHQQRLQKLITGLGAEPTQEKLGLPLPRYPPVMLETMSNTMTRQEWEMKRSEEDLICENAEVIFYLMLIQKVQAAGGLFLTAVEPLTLNMTDEAKMADWIKTNSPSMIVQLFPQVQSAVATAVAPHLSQSPTQTQ